MTKNKITKNKDTQWTDAEKEFDELCETLFELIDAHYPYTLVAIIATLARTCIKHNMPKTKILDLINKAWDVEEDIQKLERI